jgi:hypothetical protein
MKNRFERCIQKPGRAGRPDPVPPAPVAHSLTLAPAPSGLYRSIFPSHSRGPPSLRGSPFGPTPRALGKGCSLTVVCPVLSSRATPNSFSFFSSAVRSFPSYGGPLPCGALPLGRTPNPVSPGGAPSLTALPRSFAWGLRLLAHSLGLVRFFLTFFFTDKIFRF